MCHSMGPCKGHIRPIWNIQAGFPWFLGLRLEDTDVAGLAQSTDTETPL